MRRAWKEVTAIFTSRGVCEDVIARTKSFGGMFTDRRSSAAPQRAAKPNGADLQYRGKLGSSGGESGESGNWEKREEW